MIRTLWRIIWRGLVPGSRVIIAYWLAWAAYDAYRERYALAAAWAILAILNAYSYDYQRRRAAGEVMP